MEVSDDESAYDEISDKELSVEDFLLKDPSLKKAEPEQ